MIFFSKQESTYFSFFWDSLNLLTLVEAYLILCKLQSTLGNWNANRTSTTKYFSHMETLRSVLPQKCKGASLGNKGHILKEAFSDAHFLFPHLIISCRFIFNLFTKSYLKNFLCMWVYYMSSFLEWKFYKKRGFVCLFLCSLQYQNNSCHLVGTQ